MGVAGTIEVTDRDGWRKDFPFRAEKNIIYVGTFPGNDVALDANRAGGGTRWRLQLIFTAGQEGRCRLVNLADMDLLLGRNGDEPVPPRSSIVVVDGQAVRVEGFTLVFRLGPQRTASTSERIGLRLSLSDTRLAPDTPVEGVVTVRNLSDKAGVQFKLDVRGLEPDCYEIGAGPLLFPNAEKGVPLRLYHPRRPTLPAGEHTLIIRATAPEAFPQGHAEVSQTIEVLPYYHHRLRLVSKGTEGRG